MKGCVVRVVLLLLQLFSRGVVFVQGIQCCNGMLLAFPISCPFGVPVFSFCVLACHVAADCGKYVMPFVLVKCEVLFVWYEE